MLKVIKEFAVLFQFSIVIKYQLINKTEWLSYLHGLIWTAYFPNCDFNKYASFFRLRNKVPRNISGNLTKIECLSKNVYGQYSIETWLKSK